MLWREFDKMVQEGLINAVVYSRAYDGIEALPQAMLDLERGKVWGRSVITLADRSDKTLAESARL